MWAGPPPASLTNRGETNTPALYAMTDSAAYFNYIGVQDIYNRGVALGNYLKSKIAGQWARLPLGGREYYQLRSEFATALTAFNPFTDRETTIRPICRHECGNQWDEWRGRDFKYPGGRGPQDLHQVASPLGTTTENGSYPTADNRVGLRASTHGVYNNYEQIDYMFDRLVAAVETAQPMVSPC